MTTCGVGRKIRHMHEGAGDGQDAKRRGALYMTSVVSVAMVLVALGSLPTSLIVVVPLAVALRLGLSFALRDRTDTPRAFLAFCRLYYAVAVPTLLGFSALTRSKRGSVDGTFLLVAALMLFSVAIVWGLTGWFARAMPHDTPR